MKNVSKIDISDFMKVRIADGDNTYVIGKTLVVGNRIYQIIELGEASVPYLMEHRIYDDKIIYQSNYIMEMQGSDHMGRIPL